jgi:hypothetical protein
MTVRNIVWSALALAGIAGASGAEAQMLGTFRWQLRPYCNVLTLTVTAVEGTYRLEGIDDQCGGTADRASAIGTAFPNPDGTIGFGLTIVATPGGVPVHVDAALAPGAFDGTWRDSAGGSGPFVLTPGAGNGGSARPLPSPHVPAAIELRPDGSIVAAGTERGVIPASGAGTRMMWHAGKAAFRAGGVDGPQWDDQNVGYASGAFGIQTTASGRAAFAIGYATSATGESSLAAAQGSVASGEASVAIGYRATATAIDAMAFGWHSSARGGGSVALGASAVAGGENAIAIGRNNYAGGNNSVVIGGVAETTAAARGSIVLADDSPNAQPVGFQSFVPNQFLARAAGGIAFFTNAALTAGVSLSPGGNAWQNLSDAHAKHLYRELDGNGVLRKIAAMPVREWSYTTEDPAIRHIGPTAQDFREAFGLGSDPLRISTIDADGVALAAVKALEARTRTADADTQATIAALKSEIAALQSALADVQAALALARAAQRQ